MKQKGEDAASVERGVIVEVGFSCSSHKYDTQPFGNISEEEEGLEEDDLELLEENTGTSFARNRLTRLRRARDSQSPPAPSSKRKTVVESSDDDLDNDDLDLPRVQDIHNIWDDEKAALGRDDEEDADMDDFIDYEDEDEVGEVMDEEEREARRKERRRLEKAKRKAMGSRPELAGIDAK